jgi:hypothetical protein
MMALTEASKAQKKMQTISAPQMETTLSTPTTRLVYKPSKP